jgi:hypothetical protein
MHSHVLIFLKNWDGRMILIITNQIWEMLVFQTTIQQKMREPRDKWDFGIFIVQITLVSHCYIIHEDADTSTTYKGCCILG